jgi:hypothetical protein
VINDRPADVRFNSLRAHSFFNTDMRISKKLNLGETRNVEVLWEMFNLFNVANLTDFNGNQRALTFRQTRAVLPQFQAQFGVSIRLLDSGASSTLGLWGQRSEVI